MNSKKNWTMRAAVLLFALVLISSCFVGGTFAKYVTSAGGSETARVAKFGVTVTAANDTMFKTAYATDDTAAMASITNSVVSSDADKLVAPGTKEDATAMFSVTGQPEVAVRVAIGLDAQTLKDVFLKAGTYTDYTTAAGGTFDLGQDYYPVRFTLTKNGEAVVTDGTLSDVNAKLAEVSKEYAPGADLSDAIGEYKLSWKWEFEGDNRADTLLGNLAAGSATLDAAEYSTQIAFTLNATVTQID